MSYPELHAAILADLDADAPRLVLADALQAAGDPRGELIAIQCELARLGCNRIRLALIPTLERRGEDRRRDWIGDGLVDCPHEERHRIRELRSRASELLQAHDERWMTEVGGYPSPAWLLRYGRGYIDHVDAGRDPDLALVLARAPFVRSLSLELSRGRPEPIPAQLRQLRVSSLPVADALRELPHLRELAVAGGQTEELLASPLLRQLEALDLYDQHLHPDHLAALLAQARLRDLRLGVNGNGARVGATLAASPHAASLEILDLYYANPDLDLAPLVRSRHLQQLRALRVYEPTRTSCFIEGAGAIGESLPALRVLDVSGTPFARFLGDLLAGGGLASLTHLSLRGCHLDTARVDRLAAWPRLAHLRVLDLRDNALTGASMMKMVDAVSDQIERLDLRGNRVAQQLQDAVRERYPSKRVLMGYR